MTTDAESTFQWSYVVLAVLIPAAILVYYLGNVRLQRKLYSARNTEPRGRRMPRGTLKSDPQFAAFVGRALQRSVVTKIAEAGPQPIMVRGVIVSADATLGGAPGRECVWRNRSGAPRDAAVAAEFIVVADDTGRVTIENLALAEVVAPEEKSGARASSGLYLGDTVEVIARFKPERFGQDPDPTRLIYGAMGSDGNLHVRVCDRPAAGDPSLSGPARATSSGPESRPSDSDPASDRGAVSSPPSPAPAPQESTE